jgi:cell filamentation protein
MNDPYVYEGTNILKNKINLKNADNLKLFERNMSSLRIKQLICNEKLASGNFDLKHLRKIHKYIFQDIYEWAGLLRTVQITKGTVFCPAQNIEGFAADIHQSIKKQNFLQEMDKKTFSQTAGNIFGEINALHPFREGNGRTQREFMRQLARQAGWELGFESITQEQMVNASIDCFNGKYDTIVDIFENSLQKMLERRKTKGRSR